MLETLDKAIKNRTQILQGLKNNALDISGLSNAKKKAVFYERIKICNVCPLYKKGRCDDKKVISKQNLSVESFDKETMHLVVQEKGNPNEYYMTKDLRQVYRGCGCFLKVKQKSDNAYCPAGFWGGEFNNSSFKTITQEVKKCNSCKKIR